MKIKLSCEGFFFNAKNILFCDFQVHVYSQYFIFFKEQLTKTDNQQCLISSRSADQHPSIEKLGFIYQSMPFFFRKWKDFYQAGICFIIFHLEKMVV